MIVAAASSPAAAAAAAEAAVFFFLVARGGGGLLPDVPGVEDRFIFSPDDGRVALVLGEDDRGAFCGWGGDDDDGEDVVAVVVAAAGGDDGVFSSLSDSMRSPTGWLLAAGAAAGRGASPPLLSCSPLSLGLPLAAAAQLSRVVRLARSAASLSAGVMKLEARRSKRVLARWLNEGWWLGMAELAEWRWERCDGGWVKAFGCGRKGSAGGRLPRAVAFSSSSSSSLESDSGWRRTWRRGVLPTTPIPTPAPWGDVMFSVELVRTRSSSLSLSSYSSWLLALASAAATAWADTVDLGCCCCCRWADGWA